VSYRHADPDCARELELERRHLLEEEEHRRAEDRAIVRAMTSPLVALGSQIPRGATGSVLGFACLVLSIRALLTETSARFAGMVALFVGLVAPIWAIVCAVYAAFALFI
jgi:hypothetical protein